MVSSGGCYLDGFSSAVRGDATKRRFEEPSANLVFKQGQLSYGLGDKATRRIISHAFEESKREANSNAADKLSSRPEGARFKAGQNMQQELMLQRTEEQIEEEEQKLRHYLDTLAGNLHQLPEFTTSPDNPLLPHLAATAAAPDDESLADTAAEVQQKEFQDLLKARGLNSHLDLGSCVPIDDPLPPLDPLLEEAQQRELQRFEELKALELQLMTLYPHGVPKRIQVEMMRKGLMLSGVGFAA